MPEMPGFLWGFLVGLVVGGPIWILVFIKFMAHDLPKAGGDIRCAYPGCGRTLADHWDDNYIDHDWMMGGLM